MKARLSVLMYGGGVMLMQWYTGRGKTPELGRSVKLDDDDVLRSITHLAVKMDNFMDFLVKRRR